MRRLRATVATATVSAAVLAAGLAVPAVAADGAAVASGRPLPVNEVDGAAVWAVQLSLDGDRVGAVHDRTPDDRGYEAWPKSVATLRIGTDAAWTPATEADGTPLEHLRGGAFQVAGDVTLTQSTEDQLYRTYRLQWADGGRTIASDGDPQLSADGQFVLLSDEGSTQVQDVRSGDAISGLGLSGPASFDGTTLWTWQSADTLSRFDPTGSSVPQPVSVPAFSCPHHGYHPAVSVRGRWVLRVCESFGWSASRAQVTDLLGVWPDWTVPLGEWDTDLMLGRDFVTWSHYDPDHAVENEWTREVVVTDLTETHLQRRYGRLASAHTAGPAVAVDVQNAARLVYLDPDRQVRVVELDWIRPAPLVRPDRTAPSVASASAGARMTAVSTVVPPLTLSWSGIDQGSRAEPASGIASYEVRYRRHGVGQTFGPWTTPAGWQALTGTSVQLPGIADTDTCFQVRARDGAGNVGAWGPEACAGLDSSAPTAGGTSGSRLLISGTDSATFTYAAAADLAGVTGFDVQRRTARSGKPFAAWVSPTGWTATSLTRQEARLKVGEEVCFRARARDALGRVGPWSEPRCVARPLDDGNFHVAGPSRVLITSQDYLTRSIRFTEKGTGLWKHQQQGRRIAVLGYSGPKMGAINVFVNGRKVGRINFEARTAGRVVRYLDPGADWKGTVRLTTTSGARVRIDGVAFLR